MPEEDPKRSPTREKLDRDLARLVDTVVRAPHGGKAPLAREESDLDELLRELARTPGTAEVHLGQAFHGTSRFRVLRRLGAGGFGVVYLVRDLAIGADVALKTLPAARPELIYRLKREFRTLADLRHENLASFYELFCEDGACFFTMEYVPGRTFLDHVRHGGALDERRLRPALAQLARGLSALHRAGKVHRDVKPSNVLVSDAARVVILDFGLSTDIEGDGPRRSVAVAGTPGYMSPEHGSSTPLCAASDWYSVGVMLYEALTGAVPLRGAPGLRPGDAAVHLDPVPPGAPADLVELCLGLLSPDPARRPGGAEIAAVLGPAAIAAAAAAPAREPPLVGRARELARLEEALAAVRAGRGATVLVEGGSGAGKTTLVQRFLASAEHGADAVVLRGRCYERERVPYQGIDSLVDDLGRLLQRRGGGAGALLPRHASELVRLFPVLERIPAVAEACRSARGPGGDEQQLRQYGFGALRELLARIADRDLLVLHIDDLQWGDLDTAALLHELVRPPDAPVMLLVLSYRVEDRERSPCLAALGEASLGEVSRVDVGPLDSAAAEALARLFLREGQGGVDPARLAAEAGGNPFFILELARFATAAAQGGGPPDLQRALRARVQGLPPAARDLLEVVAVAGHPIAEGVARRAAGVSGPPWEAWGLLVGEHLIRFTGAPGERHVEPLHDRIRETVVSSLPPERVLACHRGLAAALEGSGTADPEALARHHEAAGDLERAYRSAVTAGEQAEQALAFDRAARLFSWALRLAPAGEDPVRLLASAAAALAHAGRGVDAAGAYLQAAERAAAGERTVLRREAALQLLISGRVDDGAEVAVETLRGVGLAIPRTPRAALASLLGHTALLWARGLGFRERPEQEIPLEVRERMDHLWALSRGFSMVDVLRGAEFAARHLLLALSSGEPRRVGMGLAVALAHGGTSAPRSSRTRAIEETLDRLDARLANPLLHAYAATAKAIHAQGLGDWPATLALADEAERAVERCTGASWEIWTARLFGVSALFYLGRWDELGRRVNAHLGDARDRGNVYAMLAMRAPYGVLAWAARGEAAEARRQLDDATASWSVHGLHLQHYWLLEAESFLALHAGEAAPAWRRLRERWPALERSLLLRIPFARTELLHARGACAVSAAAGERGAGARRELLGDAARAARGLERVGTEMSYALATLLRAAIDAQAGAHEDAAGQLERAAGQLERQGMAAHAAAARVRLARLSGASTVPAFLPGERIADPGAFVRMLAPGFD